MSLIDQDNIHKLPDLNKEKKLNNFLGTSSLMNKIRQLPEIGNFRIGCLLFISGFSLGAYYFYRKYYEQKIVVSQYHYKLINERPIIVNNEFYTQVNYEEPQSSYSWFYRIALKEFNIIYRMKSAMVKGQFDHDKEILFPSEKNGKKGFDIITRFYYYLKYVDDNKNNIVDSSGQIKKCQHVERAAIAVNRGW